MCSSVQTAEPLIVEEQTACFARMEMPWENLQSAADRGLLFTGVKKHDSSLGYVTAIVRVPRELCKQLCSDGEASLMNLHCRLGEELDRVPADLSQRSDQELASDEIFCEWQIGARDGFNERSADSARNQEAARWNFRILQSDPTELAYFVEQLARVRAEIAKRTAFTLGFSAVRKQSVQAHV